MKFGRAIALVLFAAGIWVGVGTGPSPVRAESAGAHDPLAILQRECVSCHTESKRKGGLLIDSRESLLAGGDTAPAIVPGKPEESYLVEVLFPDHLSHMPPKGQLPPGEIAAIEAWIAEGADWDAAHWASLNLPEKVEVVRGAMPPRYMPIASIALSPDGSKLAAGRGNAIDWYRVVEEGEGEKTALALVHEHTSRGHSDVVHALAFSPDGATLASGGFRSVHLWDASDPAEPRRTLDEPFLGRQTALLFPEKDRLLVADSLPTRLGRLHAIDLGSGETTTFDTAHLDSIFALALAPGGKRYVTASADKLVTVRDAKTHEIVSRLEGHTGYVLAAAFGPEGKRLATAGDDEEIKVWNLATGKKVSAFGSRGSGPVYGLAWFVDPASAEKKAAESDEEKAAAINTDRIFAVPESGKPAAFVELNEHEGEQRSTGARERAFDAVDAPLFALAVHPERQWLFAGDEDGRIHVWDENGKRKATLDPPGGAPKVASRHE